VSSLIGRRVRHTTRGYGNTAPETVEGTVQAVGLAPGDGFDLLVLLDDGGLDRWDAGACSLVPQPPSIVARLAPEWARPHILPALAGAAIIFGGLGLAMAVL